MRYPKHNGIWPDAHERLVSGRREGPASGRREGHASGRHAIEARSGGWTYQMVLVEADAGAEIRELEVARAVQEHVVRFEVTEECKRTWTTRARCQHERLPQGRACGPRTNR